MRKIKILLILVLTLFITACEKKEEEPIKLELLDKEDIIEEVYVDDSNIPLSFYLYSNNQYNRVGDNLNLPWYYRQDITVLNILPTYDNNIPGFYMQDIYPRYWNSIEDTTNYKIGFNVKFTTTDGEIDCNILKPSDRFKELFYYIAIFLYDDVNAARDSWYDHVDDDEVTDNTIYSSIKVHANVDFAKVISPIKLTVFAYNGEEDFDPETGNYRGKSYTELYINKTN